jgi:hypothetical protein
MGLASSSISKMRSSLSLRGMIHRWWRFVRTEATPSPASARLHSALVSDSNRSWREEGNTPWFQASIFAISTLPV